MIIPRHKVCDVCGQDLTCNIRYYIIKSKSFITSYAGDCNDNRKHHVCEMCVNEFKSWLEEKLKGETDED